MTLLKVTSTSIDNILSQGLNATLFYFGVFSDRKHALSHLIYLHKSSFSSAFNRTLALDICLKLFKKQSILLRKGH